MLSQYHINIPKDFDLTKESLPLFNDELKKIQKYYIEQIQPYSNTPKIVFLGMTGSGKSCILCSLSNKPLLINSKNNNNIMHLEGEGIGIGLNSYTCVPIIAPNPNGTSIFIDSPGLEDSNGYVREILNAFSIYNIFAKNPNHSNKFKIILLISYGEFVANKGIKMANSFLRLEQMFPIGDKLKDNIGLVITKGPSEFEGIDHIQALEEQIQNTENPPEHLIKICNFFISNPDHVFSFPMASKKDKGKQYVFDDHDRLLEFSTKNLLIDPVHKMTLSLEAKLKLELIRNDHAKKLANSVENLCQKIYHQLSAESKSIELQKWYNIIISLSKADIKKSNELKLFLKNNVPKSEQYQKDLEEIAQYELFDEFIDKIFYAALDTSCLNEVIRIWCSNASYHLHQSIVNAISAETTKEGIAKLERLRKESEIKINEIQNIIAENDRKMRENAKRHSEEMNKLLDEIKRLEKELEDEKSKKPANQGGGGGGCLLI